MNDGLEMLRLLERSRGQGLSFTKEEGLELIRARRRGVTIGQLRNSLGKKSGRGNLMEKLGRWACLYAILPDGDESNGQSQR